MYFAKFPQKFELLDKRGFKLTEKRKSRQLPVPWPMPIHKLNMTSIMRNISIGQLGLSDCAPSQILHIYTLAEYEESP